MKTMIPILMLYVSFSAHAQWSGDPTVNTPICTAANNQSSARLISDGAGGTIITWGDYRSGTDNYIYAQRINPNGEVEWSANGVALSTTSGGQYSPMIISDGAGGAIVTWEDGRGGPNSDIYAQRINASGAIQWATNGVAISTASGIQFIPRIVSDGGGGAIITWQQYISVTNFDVYAQRINGSGVVQWAANGVAISTASGNQQEPKIVSDGSGGAIIAWFDRRSGDFDIYAQRINGGGAVQWTANGIAISTASGTQSQPTISSDGSGGAIITWVDLRGTDIDIYAQRINGSGVVQWAANGVAISTASGNQVGPTIVTDGSTGAIITWYDYRSGPTGDIYAQRIDASGVVQWTPNGVAISIASGDQRYAIIVNDGSGGAIISWEDFRSGTTSDIYAQKIGTRVRERAENLLGSDSADIYAQRINGSGVVQWTPNGVAISTASVSQEDPAIVSDGSVGAIITWRDSRSGGTNADIYAQQVRSDGSLGGTTAVDDNESVPMEFSLHQNYPNPFNPVTNIEFRIANFGFVSLKVFDMLGREVATQVNENLNAGSYTTKMNAVNIASGVYFYRLQAGSFSSVRKMILAK